MDRQRKSEGREKELSIPLEEELRKSGNGSYVRLYTVDGDYFSGRLDDVSNGVATLTNRAWLSYRVFHVNLALVVAWRKLH